jgi:hypothetical protein
MAQSALVNHKEVTLNSWKGLFSRGETTSVPKGYFPDCLNVEYFQDEVRTRDGFGLHFAIENVVRYFEYQRLNEATRFLILDSDGNFYDSLDATPLITNVAFLDFSAVNINNRAYISFHNRVSGITGTYIYVYEGDGPGTLRVAAAAPPVGFTLGATTSAASGFIEAGTYLFAVVYVTDSGFITSPGPLVFTEYTAPGGYAVDFSTISVGPAGTASRWILSTQTIVDYNGNQIGYEFFFIPTGRITNNVDTTLAEISFFAADLITSADYLFDNIAQLPAALGLTTYGNRMVFWTGDHDIWISKNNEPEVFDQTNGFQTVDKSNVISGVTNAIDFRGQLYITKRNGCYVTQDNGSDPLTWGISDVDRAVGTEVFGIGRLKDSRGSNINRFFLADYSGAKVFESGSFRSPSMSWSIDDTWARINKLYFNMIQVDHDEENSIVYFAVPLDAATTLSHILVANYQDAFDKFGMISPSGVKWSIWTLPWTVSSVSVLENASAQAVLSLSGTTGGIYIQEADRRNDEGTIIESYIETYLAEVLPDWVHHYASIQLDIRGSGDIKITFYSARHLTSLTLSDMTITNTSQYWYRRLLNFQAAKASVKIRMAETSNYFILTRLILKTKPIWEEIPG